MAEAAEQADLFNQAMAPEAQEAPEVTQEAPVAEPPKPEPPRAEPQEDIIPSWRLREEAEARRVAEDRARQLEGRLNEIVSHLQQNQPKPDFFADPNKATEALVLRALQPIIEENKRSVEENRKAVMHMGRMVAETAYGADKVAEAEQAFLKAHAAQALDTMDYERVVQSPNRYAAVVDWYQRQNVLSAVGTDPAAWFQKQLEERLADPKFQSELLGKIRSGATGKPGAVNIPPSLSRSTSAAPVSGELDGDMSDRSLFAFAMKK